MKKNNPGCDCCGGCDRCTFKCDGDLCPTICGLRINIVDPESIPRLVGDACPPTDICPDSAPCNRCFSIFDTLFSFYSFVNNWGTVEYSYPGYVNDCNDVIYTFKNSTAFGRGQSLCWDANTYNCNYGWLGETLCGANLAIDSAEINIRTQWNPSTNCGKITVNIVIDVFETKCVYVIGEPIKEATFDHLFELDYCTCEEMLQPIPFVSTIADNPYDLPEPCNLDEATLTLYSADQNSAGCPACSCWECSLDNTVNIAVSGPGFTGTIPVTFMQNNTCSAYGSFVIDCDGERTVTVNFFVIDCDRCEYYDLRIGIYTTTSTGQVEQAAFDLFNYQCGDDATFTLNNSNSLICNLDEYTFSL